MWAGGSRYRSLTLGTVPAVVTARPKGMLGPSCTVIPGPALRAVPQPQAHLKVCGGVFA